MTNRVAPSELIINSDGSVFHLHIKPHQLAEKIILVGDPGRIAIIASLFDSVEAYGQNREFVWSTGFFGGCRITALSTGIGADNIDIVINELDALANIDFVTREIKKDIKKLTVVRLGTCGGLQKDIALGSFIMSAVSIGIDCSSFFYKDSGQMHDTPIALAFNKHLGLDMSLAYSVESSPELISCFEDIAYKGVSLTAPGFYAAQGRKLRLDLTIDDMIPKMESFEFNGHKITNIEMEASAIGAMCKLLGHDFLTVCVVVAQRHNKAININYNSRITDLITEALNRLSKL